MTPKGIPVCVSLEEKTSGDSWAECAVRKDAGDDYDVTNGILVYARAEFVKDKNFYEKVQMSHLESSGFGAAGEKPGLSPENQKQQKKANAAHQKEALPESLVRIDGGIGMAPGQKQRLGLARALILRPKVIIADEALASLDMSMRSQLINLMLELQEKQGISYIYVTQHLGMMKHISDQVLVMHQGEVVERGSTADVLASPLHDLTKRLIAGHFGEALTADAWRKDR